MSASAVQIRIGVSLARQRALAAAARTRRMADPETTFPIAGQILDATSDAARATLVLRLPDALAVKHSADLRDACLTAGFRDGACFIDVRVLAAHAVRTPDGELPSELAERLETWRRGMAALAGGIS